MLDYANILDHRVIVEIISRRHTCYVLNAIRYKCALYLIHLVYMNLGG